MVSSLFYHLLKVFLLPTGVSTWRPQQFPVIKSLATGFSFSVLPRLMTETLIPPHSTPRMCWRFWRSGSSLGSRTVSSTSFRPGPFPISVLSSVSSWNFRTHSRTRTTAQAGTNPSRYGWSLCVCVCLFVSTPNTLRWTIDMQICILQDLLDDGSVVDVLKRHFSLSKDIRTLHKLLVGRKSSSSKPEKKTCFRHETRGLCGAFVSPWICWFHVNVFLCTSFPNCVRTIRSQIVFAQRGDQKARFAHAPHDFFWLL